MSVRNLKNNYILCYIVVVSCVLWQTGFSYWLMLVTITEYVQSDVGGLWGGYDDVCVVSHGVHIGAVKTMSCQR